MKIMTKVGATWKQVKKIFVKQGSTWKEVKKIFIKQGGVWKQTYSSSPVSAGAIDFATIINKYTVSPENGALENGAAATSPVVPDTVRGGNIKGVVVYQQYNSGKVSVARWILAVVYTGTPDPVPTIPTPLRVTNLNTGMTFVLPTGPTYDSDPNETVMYSMILRDSGDIPYPPNPFEGFIRDGQTDTFRIEAA